MTDYATSAQVKSYLSITDTGRDTLIALALTAASRQIDGYCGRRFYLDGSATARTYTLRGRTVRNTEGEQLQVDDIGSTSGLIVETGVAGGSTWTALTDYETLPDNALARSVPITELRRINLLWAYNAQTRIRVTAKWGWPAVPDAVLQATLLLTARLLKRKDSPEGVAGSAEWGLIRLSRIDPDVQALLQPFAVPSFG